MDASADYAQVVRALSNARLPAYVSYTVRSSAGFDAFRHVETTELVVRTSDGKIVRGKPPAIKIASDDAYQSDVVRHPPFDPACYTATGATAVTFESQSVEAIALAPRCSEQTSSDHSDATEFHTLYIDATTHMPLAVVGGSADHFVSAHVDERFGDTHGFVLPSNFHVTVSGSGPMFWLNVDARQTFENYRFAATPP